MGPLSVIPYPADGTGTQIDTYQDQYSVGGFAAYAIDYGGYWLVRIETPVYNGSYVDTKALAHVYYDYGS